MSNCLFPQIRKNTNKITLIAISISFLQIKLAQHVFSCMFGTFMCNTYKERIENSLFDRTYSVWPFLSGPMYKNPLYVPNREQVSNVLFK